MLVGINGVGKSVISKKLQEDRGDAVVISASNILKNTFGGMTYAELEKVSPEEKFKKLELITIRLFTKNSANTIILDTHLVACNRLNENVTFENMWSDKYIPFIRNLFLIRVNPEEILRRRKIDEMRTGRIRDTNLDNIIADQQRNQEEYEILASRNVVDCAVIDNSRELSEAVNEIKEKIETNNEINENKIWRPPLR